jgi:hypothetical protein
MSACFFYTSSLQIKSTCIRSQFELIIKILIQSHYLKKPYLPVILQPVKISAFTCRTWAMPTGLFSLRD